jgi:hypothetical protein
LEKWHWMVHKTKHILSHILSNSIKPKKKEWIIKHVEWTKKELNRTVFWFVVIEARNLTTPHRSRDPNPFCIVKCQGQQFQTEFVKDTINPKWNETFILYIFFVFFLFLFFTSKKREKSVCLWVIDLIVWIWRDIRTAEAKLRFTVWDKDKKADPFLVLKPN